MIISSSWIISSTASFLALYDHPGILSDWDPPLSSHEYFYLTMIPMWRTEQMNRRRRRTFDRSIVGRFRQETRKESSGCLSLIVCLFVRMLAPHHHHHLRWQREPAFISTLDCVLWTRGAALRRKRYLKVINASHNSNGISVRLLGVQTQSPGMIWSQADTAPPLLR